jgi:hypothetical protein
MFVRLILSCLLLLTTVPAHAAESLLKLDDTSTPLAARQVKAQVFLRSLGFASVEFAERFTVNDEDDLVELANALDRLLLIRDSPITSGSLSEPAEHYLVWSIARAEMVNSLDFSDERLSHFHGINSKRYPCVKSARVSELLIPQTYINSRGSSSVLTEVAERLQTESFAVVSYQVNDKFGKPSTGLIGERSLQQAGEQRFNLYREAHQNGGTGGPYETPEGYLFVKVHSMADNASDCFSYHREQVIVDYGREWLRKIYNDTITTAMQSLKPEIREYTTGTAIESTAYIIDGHEVSFAGAKAQLPFLYGDASTQRFWNSIQRQALEVELIYHSQQGKAIRSSHEYQDLAKVLKLVQAAQDKLPAYLAMQINSASLRRWFSDNAAQFTQTGKLSYELYGCASAKGSDCTARLEQFVSAGGRDAPADLVKDEMTSVAWETRSREIQVACQELEPGEWSEVFSENGQPQVLFLKEIDRKVPKFQEVQERARQLFEQKLREDYWKAVLEGTSGPGGKVKQFINTVYSASSSDNASLPN